MRSARSLPLIPLSALAGILGVACVASAQDFTRLQVKQPNGVTRYSEPILSPDKALGEKLVFNPTVIEIGDRLAMIYRRNASGQVGSHFQLAFSDDGRTFVP